ncbi:MAG: pilus assembly protein TadG-related protein [Gemmatimonadaceae bacterium]
MRARILRNERGSMMVLAAIVLPVLLGFAALALDAGYFFDYKQRMGAAADGAAMAAAFEVKRNFRITQADLETYARDDAARNGFTDGTDGVTVTVTRPPATGLHIGDSAFVEVVVSRPTPTFFAKIFGSTSVPIAARAVATISDDNAGCVFALNTADPKYPIEFDINKSGTHINVPKCAIISNGNFEVVSGSSIDSAAEILVTAASRTGTGTVNPGPQYNVPPTPDPFGDLDEAGLFGTNWTCGWSGSKKSGGVTTPISGTGALIIKLGTDQYTMNPGVYCGNSSQAGMDITGGTIASGLGPCNPATDGIVNFNPGVYIVLGAGFKWIHVCTAGTGVVFYASGTAANPYGACGANVFATDPPARYFLSAPTASTANFKKWPGTSYTTAAASWTVQSAASYEGLLFIQDRLQGTLSGHPSANCNSNPIKLDFQPDAMTLDGAIYYPNHHIIYGASTYAAGNYMVLIAGTLLFDGTAAFNSNFTSLANGSPIKTVGLGE